MGHESRFRLIDVDRAVGHVLAHDITEVRPGEFKGRAFKKGHVVREQDIEYLKRLGKEHLYILEIPNGELHEDDAAIRLAKAISGPGTYFDQEPSEGKVSIRAIKGGLLKIDVEALVEINMVPDICVSTLHTNSVVVKDQVVASTRAIPLLIKEEFIKEVERIAGASGIISILELKTLSVGIVVTGNEVYKGLIKDRFAPTLTKKLENYNCAIIGLRYSPDQRESIKAAILQLLDEGAEMILVAGGMSVDPDDVSRHAIYDAGATEVVYGTPVLPGSMFLYGRIRGLPVLGLPAAIIFYETTIFDVLLPRVLAGEKITRKDLAVLAHGGHCLFCKVCRFPICPFAKAG